MLCHWHASQNVEHKGAGCLLRKRHRKVFMQCWKNMLHEYDERKADAKWDKLVNQFSGLPGGSEAIKYVEKQWRTPHIWHRIAACHTKAHRHYGIRTTGGAESSHSSLKAALPRIAHRRRLYLLDTMKATIKWIGKRYLDAKAHLAEQKKVPVWLQADSRTVQLARSIATPALDILQEELQAAEQDQDRAAESRIATASAHECCADLITPSEGTRADKFCPIASDAGRLSCPTWTTQGIPCRHRISLIWLSGRKALTPADFASWHHLDKLFEESNPAGDGAAYFESKLILHQSMAAMMDRLLPHFEFKQPTDEAERQERAIQAYLADPQEPWTATTALIAPPRKAKAVPFRPGLREMDHQASKRLLTGAEWHRKEQQAEERMSYLHCGLCGQAGHTRRDCQATVSQYEAHQLSQRQLPPPLTFAEAVAAMRSSSDASRSTACHGIEPLAAVSNKEANNSTSTWLPEPPAPLLDPALFAKECFHFLCDSDSDSTRPVKGDVAEPVPTDAHINESDATAAPISAVVKDKPSATPLSPFVEQKPSQLDPVAVEPPPPAVTEDEPSQLDPVAVEPPPPAVTEDEPSQLDPVAVEPPPPAVTEDEPSQLDPVAVEPPPPAVTENELTAQSPEQPLPAAEEVADALTSNPTVALGVNEVKQEAIPSSDVKSLIKRWCMKIHSVKSDGNCGYSAIGLQISILDPFDVRLAILEWLKEAVKGPLRHLNSKQVSGIKNRLFKGGRKPTLATLNKLRRLELQDKATWLSACDLWVIAVWQGRPIVVCSKENVDGFYTILPVSAGPRNAAPAPIGLLYSTGHWRAATIRSQTSLPPVVTAHWGRKADEILQHPEHKYWHRHYQFDQRKTADKGRCGCFVSSNQADEANAVEISDGEGPVVISDDDEKLVVASLGL
ncbi:unnamed protein product [Jaminaea pallidilutea]